MFSLSQREALIPSLPGDFMLSGSEHLFFTVLKVDIDTVLLSDIQSIFKICNRPN